MSYSIGFCSNFMRQQAMSSKMAFNRPVPVNRLVSAIADSMYETLNSHSFLTSSFLEAQVNTQEYGRRPYGVGFLVIGQDKSGPHLYEFSPSGNSYEYYAMSIGARSQSAKTYLEKHYESFADCMSLITYFLEITLTICIRLIGRSYQTWSTCPP